MAIGLRGQSSISTGSSVVLTTATTGNAAAMGNPIATDFCLIWMIGRAATVTFTATGFTAVTVSQGQTVSAQLLWRIIDGTESWPITVTCSVADNFAGQCICYSGVKTTTAFDPTPAASGQTNASSTSVTPASITTTIVGDQLVWFGGVRSVASGGVPPTITLPPGSTPTFVAESSQTATSAGSVANVAAVVADGAWGSSGAVQPVGTCTAAITAAMVVALEVAAAATPLPFGAPQVNQSVKRAAFI